MQISDSHSSITTSLFGALGGHASRSEYEDFYHYAISFTRQSSEVAFLNWDVRGHLKFGNHLGTSLIVKYEALEYGQI